MRDRTPIWSGAGTEHPGGETRVTDTRPIDAGDRNFLRLGVTYF